MTIKN